jgi:hypothetical protein
MPERDAAGLSRLDVQRAHSMADEGGASAALAERRHAPLDGWGAAAAGLAAFVGLAAGVALVRLWRVR